MIFTRSQDTLAGLLAGLRARHLAVCATWRSTMATSFHLISLALSEGAYPCSRKGENFGPVLRGRNQKRLWCNLFPEDRKAWPATFPDGKQAGLGHQRSHWISADLFSRAGFVSTYQTTSIEHGLSKEATHG